MTEGSPSPCDQEEPGRRRLSSHRHGFLSHLHAPRARVLYPAIDTSSDNLVPKGQAPVAVPCDMIHRGGQGAAHQPHEDASGTLSTMEHGARSKGAVAPISPGTTTRPLEEASRVRGPTAVGDASSKHAANTDGEFTFRCSSTLPITRVSYESPGFDLVGSVICGPSESPISSISSHRCSGRSSAGREKVLDSWLRETIKLRSVVIGKRAAQGVPIVSKSLIELAKARREREAIEESDSDSDSDSDSSSSSSTPQAANGGHDDRVTRMSTFRNLPSVRPTATFRSPAEPLSGGSPILLMHKKDNDGRGVASNETKGLARTSMLASSRSAISLTPRVTFKSHAVAGGTPFESSPLVQSEKTSESDFGHKRLQSRVIHGAGRGEVRKAGGGQGISGGGSKLGPMKGSPGVSPATVKPMVRTSAEVLTAVVTSPREGCGESHADSTQGTPNTASAVAQPAAKGLSGTTVPPSNGTRREPAADSLAIQDSPIKSTTPAHKEAKTGDTPKKTVPPDMSVFPIASVGIDTGDSAGIGFLPRETAGPTSAREESPSARFHSEAALSSENKRKSPGVCGSDQDTIGSGAKPTENKNTPGAAVSTQQDVTAIHVKGTDLENQAIPRKVQLTICGSAAKVSDESINSVSGSILQNSVLELNGSAIGQEDSKEGQLSAVLRPTDGELRPKATEEPERGNQKEGLCLRQCGPARGAEKEEVGGKEGTRSGRKATAVSLALAANESDRKKHPDGYGVHGETKHAELPKSERTAPNEESPSQARRPAHSVVGSHQRDTTPAANKEHENSQPMRTTAHAVCATVPADTRLDSAQQEQFESSPAPNAILRSPVKLSLSVESGDSNRGGKGSEPADILGGRSYAARRDGRYEESSRRREAATSHTEALLSTTAGGTGEPPHVRVLAEAATSGNGGSAIRSRVVSSTGLPRSDCDGGVCDDKWRCGNNSPSLDGRSAKSMEVRRNSVIRDPWGVTARTGATLKILSGGSKENVTALSTVNRKGADGSWTRKKCASSKLESRDVENSDTHIVKDAQPTSFQAEASLVFSNVSSSKEPAAISPVETTGTAPQGRACESGKGAASGADLSLSASWLAFPSTSPYSIARDRWSVRILVEARATLACCGVSGRSASDSVETDSGPLPSVEDDNRYGHKVMGTERRGSGGRGSCSTLRARRKRRLSLPIMHARNSSLIGHRKHLGLPIARARSRASGVAASAGGWTACCSASSELPMTVDVQSCLVGGSASKLVARRGCTMRLRHDRKGSPGPVENTDGMSRPAQRSPQRSQRRGSGSAHDDMLVPTRPPGRAHPLDGMSTCVSRAFLVGGKTSATDGPRRDREDGPVGFHGHAVVSPVCWMANGDDGGSCGRGFVAGSGEQGILSPAPQRISTENAVRRASRRSCWSVPSPPQLPVVVDTGSLEVHHVAPAWEVDAPGPRPRKSESLA